VQLGPAEILVILVVALLVFGPSRLPEIGRQVGRGVREFRKFQESLRNEVDDAFADDASEHAEPAPTLPPREVESGPAADPAGADEVASDDRSEPPSPPAAGSA
jgi:sec-independent protein translocase protein TatA